MNSITELQLLLFIALAMSGLYGLLLIGYT
jgi:hypothetical protein